MLEINATTDIEELYKKIKLKILKNFEEHQLKHSGWNFKEVKETSIHFVDHNPLNAGSYIKLPEFIAKKKAIINLKNESDDECFKWCITRAKNPVTSHPERITKLLRKQSEEFDWEGIKFPMKLEDISKFERRNPGIFINVFGFENKSIYVLKCGNSENGNDTINLLYYAGEGDNKHFSLIKSISRLVAKQTILV